VPRQPLWLHVPLREPLPMLSLAQNRTTLFKTIVCFLCLLKVRTRHTALSELDKKAKVICNAAELIRSLLRPRSGVGGLPRVWLRSKGPRGCHKQHQFFTKDTSALLLPVVALKFMGASPHNAWLDSFGERLLQRDCLLASSYPSTNNWRCFYQPLGDLNFL
jgi:hypothetical protein